MDNEEEISIDPFEAAVAEIARGAVSRYLIEWLWLQHCSSCDAAIFDKPENAEYRRGYAAGITSVMDSVLSVLPKDYQLNILLMRNSSGAKLSDANNEAKTL